MVIYLRSRETNFLLVINHDMQIIKLEQKYATTVEKKTKVEPWKLWE